MKKTASLLLVKIEDSKPKLLAISDLEASKKINIDKWSIKEILGHLCDSAATNQQRIVRMQENASIGKYVYEQNHWVKSQNYQEKNWEDLVHFWYFYNQHLAHIISNIDEKTLENTCDMGYDFPKNLRFVATDYVEHLEHHLKQIFNFLKNK